MVEEKIIRMTGKEFERLRWKSGVSSMFHPMGGKPNNIRKMGLKIERDCTGQVYRRDANYKRQARAHRAGLAPPVGKKVMLIVDNRERVDVYRGFETGIAVVKSGSAYMEYGSKERNKLERMKLDADLHDENVGLWKGKKVLIDFGSESVRTEY
jgi:hypothetical protein